MYSGADGMERMARIGSFGEHAQNLYRGLCNLFGHPVGAPAIDWVEIPTVEGRKTPVPFIFPHKFFSKLYAERPDIWFERVVGGERGLFGILEWDGRFGVRHAASLFTQARLESHRAARLPRRRRCILCPRQPIWAVMEFAGFYWQYDSNPIPFQRYT